MNKEGVSRKYSKRWDKAKNFQFGQVLARGQQKYSMKKNRFPSNDEQRERN